MKKHYRHENDCLNCGTTLEGKFCHNCGQENLQIKESFGHMMNHAISDYFHFDHQFFHTLKPLLFKPGYLTNEYMAGRRVQYLHPVKMYIFISLVYFLLLFQGGHQDAKENNTAAKPANTQKVIDSVNREIANDKGVTAEQKKQIINYAIGCSLVNATGVNQFHLFIVKNAALFPCQKINCLSPYHILNIINQPELVNHLLHQ